MTGVDGSVSLRAIAAFEWAKGAAALLLALGLLAFGPDSLREVFEHLVARLHIGYSHGPFAWIDRQIATPTLDLVAVLCGFYAAFRLAEGWGLWRNRNWAAWLGVGSTALYLPLDVLAIARHPGLLSLAVLALNAAILAILAFRLKANRSGKRPMHRTLLSLMLVAGTQSLSSCDRHAPEALLPEAAVASNAPADPRVVATPVNREFKDFVVGCDNTASCTAVGIPAEGESELVLILRRDAGPSAIATVQITAARPLKAADVHVDGKPSPIAKLPWRTDTDGTLTLTGADAVEFVAAVRNAGTIGTGAGAEAPSVSLAGLAATLLFIDETQGRLDTTTALLRTGPRPAALVPDAPPASALPPAAPMPRVLSEGQAERIAAIVRRQQTVALKRQDCDQDSGVTAPDQAVALTATEALVFLTCTSGAYQSDSLLFRAPLDGGDARRIQLPALPFKRTGDGALFDTLVEADYDPATATLSSHFKGRGLGDCGEDVAWRFDGSDFRLVRYSALDRCGGALPDAWPVLWRTDAKP